jgi:methyl-accepting chemotaxis protein
MNKSRWLKLLTIFVGAIVLIFLTVKSMSINLEKHQQYQKALAHQNEEKAIINQELLKSKYELFFSYDPLVNHLSELKQTQEQLNLIPKFIDSQSHQDFQQILAENAEAIEQAESLIEKFKTQNSAFKNSLRYLPSLAAEIVKKTASPNTNPNFAVSLDELVQNILLYNLTSTQELTSSVKTTIEKLQQLREETIDEEDLFLIDIAKRHGEIIFSYRPQIDQLTQKILQLLNTQRSEQLDQAYNFYYQKAVNETITYRYFAYGWSLILLSWIASLAINRTLKLLKKSQQAELALQTMNQQLEAQVKERTAQLSELWAFECLSVKKQRREKEKLQTRVRELQTEIAPVSRGDLTVRARVTEDEIGTIAEFYNFTLENLQQIVIQVQTVVQQVVNNTKTNESAIQKLSELIQAEKTEIAVTREKIQAMAESIRMIGAKAERAETIVTPMVHTGEKGTVLLKRTLDEMLLIQAITAKTNQKIQLLRQSSQKIAQIARLMYIMCQVNLPNNGAAVYSDCKAPKIREESQNLSLMFDQSPMQLSQQAVNEIEKLIVEIQGEINEVIVTMKKSIQETTNRTLLVRETRQSINQIASTSTQINQLVNSISLFASEQSQISGTVQEILENLATQINKTSVSADDVSTSFKKLLVATQQLQDSVSQFKVN